MDTMSNPRMLERFRNIPVTIKKDRIIQSDIVMAALKRNQHYWEAVQRLLPRSEHWTNVPGEVPPTVIKCKWKELWVTC